LILELVSRNAGETATNSRINGEVGINREVGINWGRAGLAVWAADNLGG
jgi:hypothetical protein